jgi:hypothetical protein
LAKACVHGTHALLEVHMTRSIVFAALLVAVLAACAQQPVPPPAADSSVNPLTSSFVPYCGPIWLIGGQGYRTIPCPPGSSYPGAQ